jgi:hypothetical protein
MRSIPNPITTKNNPIMIKKHITSFPERGRSFFKHIFGGAAYGADPTVKEFIKGGLRRDVILPTALALFRIVYITTDITFIFVHLYLLYPQRSIFQFERCDQERLPRDSKIPLEAKYRHLLEIYFHATLKKVRR